MKTTLNFIALILSLLTIAQEPNSNFQSTQLPTYSFDDPNPLPALAFNPKIYPYHKFEGYRVTPSPQTFKLVRLENDYITVEVLPEVGGKVWGAVDKSNGNEFIYKNEVIKFRDIAMRGPWTSGGIEFNFGIIGHHPGTATPVDYTVETLPDGTQVCVVGTIDLPSRTQWRVRIELEPNKGAFATQATWYNPTATEKAYYNWMTAAAAAKKDLVLATPGNAYLKHDGTAMPWPKDDLNRNLARYAENDFGSSKSYHVVGTYNDFFGGYYEQDEVGFGHWGRYDEIPGQKLWLWDLSRFGGIWEDLLTDTDGQYIEYQAGRLFVQYFPGAENPITQATFEPHQTDQWTEVWFPLKNTKGLNEASALGALNVVSHETKLEVYVNPFYTTAGSILFQQGTHKQEQKALFKANEMHHFSFDLPSKKAPFSIDINALALRYESTPEILNRPFVTPADLAGYDSNAIRFQKGLNAQRFRLFEEAEKHFLDVLEQDAAHLGARAALGALHFDNGLPQKGLEIVLEGLGLDTYHAELNYVAGLNYLALNDLVNATESLGWAARSLQFRSSAQAHLSQIALLKKNYKEALHYANQALDFNTKNILALSYRYLAQAALNQEEEAQQTLQRIKTIDPLHHLLSFEAFLKGSLTLDQLRTKHQSEFPYQTFLELALLYHNTGFTSKAIKVLEASPKHMLTNLWLAYIKQNQAALQNIFEQSVDFVFPFRRESVAMLQWAATQSNHWKANYLLALNLMGLNQKEKGRALLEELGSQPETANFYWIRAHLTGDVKSQTARFDLLKAYEKEPKNWRIALDYAALLEQDQQWNKALSVLKKIQQAHPQNFRIGLRIAAALNATQQYEKAATLLSQLYVLPYEHATGSRKIYTKAYWGSALNALHKENWKQAQTLLEQALEWPEKLGVGKPFDPEERLTLLLLAFTKQQLGLNTAVPIESIVNYSKQHLIKGGKNCVVGLYALQLLEGETAAKAYAQQLQQVGGDQKAIQEALDYFFSHPATSLSLPFLEQLVAFIW